jgi:hypothetical protein
MGPTSAFRTYWAFVRIPWVSSNRQMVMAPTSAATPFRVGPAIDVIDITQRNRSFNSMVVRDEI